MPKGIPSAMSALRQTLGASGFMWTAALALDRAGVPVLRAFRGATVSHRVLEEQIGAILRGWRMPEEQSAIVTRHILYADLHGIDSHGCAMLRHYHRGLTDGSLSASPVVSTLRETATTALIDGGGGLGHFPADTAMKTAINKCRESGVGIAAVRNSGHFGAAGTYALMAAEAGLIGMVTTNTATPAVVPTFGVEAMLGTNPIAFAAPAKTNRPFLLDMATSTAPFGKLLTAWRRGASIPAGWALDSRGSPLTSARRAAQSRRLTPLGSTREMGSHKGYGLASVVEVLSSVLPGLRARQREIQSPNRVGHFFLALDPKNFREDGQFEAD
ncbi:MAG: Ldh family oxidoreductase, partial [Tepidisphaeraceae bacterium]